MPKVLSRSSAGKRIVIDNYYANTKSNIPLGALYAPTDPRSPNPKIVYKAHRKLSLEPVTFTHLLKVATDLPSPVLSNNSLTMAIASDVSIDSVPVMAGDLMEVNKALATSLRTSPGTWEFSDKKTATLKNPPIYTLTTSWAFGWGWRFRVDPDTGDLIGLTNVVPSNQVITQGSIAINAMSKLIDGNMSTWTDGSSLNSGQSASISFTPVDVRRIVIKVTSSKLPGDKSLPSATFGFRNQSGQIGSWFTNIRTKQPAANGAFSYARGSEEIWATDTTLRNISGFQINDNGGSRLWITMEMCIDGPCQINVKGEIPSNGSTVIIPEYLSDDFFPRIEPGEFTVVENSGGTTQWRLHRK